MSGEVNATVEEMRERLAKRAAELKLTAESEARLGRILDRNIVREWYTVRRPNAEPMEVFFWPAQTLPEVLARYPGCGVLPR